MAANEPRGTGVRPGGDAWAEFARLAGAPALDVPSVAVALQHVPGGAGAEAALAGALRVLVEEPPYGREGDVSGLIVAVGAKVIVPLMRRFAEDVNTRRRLLLAAGRNLTPEAAARLVLAAAAAWERPCSRPFMELLAKLTKAANAGDKGSGVAIRGLTRLVADRWGDVTADASSYTYEEMMEATERPAHHRQAFPEPERLIELAAELNTLTGETWRAVADMADRNQSVELLAILRRAPKESDAARAIVQHVATPARLKSVLAEEPVDLDAADQLVRALGMSAADVLLDRLALAQSREERAPLLERLSLLGPMVAPMAVSRLHDHRWFVQANMLALLRTGKHCPREVSLENHAAHPDARVRREALQLLLEADPGRRNEAIVLGLRDHDPQNVHIVLQAARGACPPEAVNALTFLLQAPTTPAFLRVPAIRLLAEVGTGAALELLLRIAGGPAGFMGKRKLAAKTPEMLAALAGLRSYRGDKRGAELLALAGESRDDDIRAAAAGKA